VPDRHRKVSFPQRLARLGLLVGRPCFFRAPLPDRAPPDHQVSPPLFLVLSILPWIRKPAFSPGLRGRFFFAKEPPRSRLPFSKSFLPAVVVDCSASPFFRRPGVSFFLPPSKLNDVPPLLLFPPDPYYDALRPLFSEFSGCRTRHGLLFFFFFFYALPSFNGASIPLSEQRRFVRIDFSDTGRSPFFFLPSIFNNNQLVFLFSPDGSSSGFALVPGGFLGASPFFSAFFFCPLWVFNPTSFFFGLASDLSAARAGTTGLFRAGVSTGVFDFHLLVVPFSHPQWRRCCGLKFPPQLFSSLPVRFGSGFGRVGFFKRVPFLWFFFFF